jgi:hypothetical protein
MTLLASSQGAHLHQLKPPPRQKVKRRSKTYLPIFPRSHLIPLQLHQHPVTSLTTSRPIRNVRVPTRDDGQRYTVSSYGSHSRPAEHAGVVQTDALQDPHSYTEAMAPRGRSLAKKSVTCSIAWVCSKSYRVLKGEKLLEVSRCSRRSVDRMSSAEVTATNARAPW